MMAFDSFHVACSYRLGSDKLIKCIIIYCLSPSPSPPNTFNQFEIAQYKDKRAVSIANLVVTTWLSVSPIPIEITYDQGREFIDHGFRNHRLKWNMG